MSIKIISRGKGKSAVAAAAYRAGEKITNAYDGLTHDYTRKGGVAHTEILLPENAPPEYAHRAVLWNAVEQAERNKNAQLAREIELALPVELTREQNIQLARDYCQQNFVNAGMCADICIHDKEDGKVNRRNVAREGPLGGNPHAHVLLTMRPIEPGGGWGAKSKKEYLLDENGERIVLPSGSYKTRKAPANDWNDRTKAEQWRAAWAGAVNAALEREGVAGRIDHRSYERQGVEQVPTVHLGVAAFQMEKRGIRTERGDTNRQVQLDNAMLRQLRARLRKLQKALDGLLEETATPTLQLADVLTGILENPEGAGRRKKIRSLQTFAKAVAFVQQYQIKDLPALRETVTALYAEAGDAADRLNKTDRRLKTLDTHIRQAEIYLRHKKLWGQYRAQKHKKQPAFYDSHRADLMQYEAAKRYLDGVLNGRTAIPLAAWKQEATDIAATRLALYNDYTTLKEKVQSAEAIRRCVEDVLREEPKRARQQGREL